MTSKPGTDGLGPFKNQERYWEIKKHFNDDEKLANKYIASYLRKVADHLENSDDWPFVFGVKGIPLPNENQKLCGDSFIETYCVTLSYPWPG